MRLNNESFLEYVNNYKITEDAIQKFSYDYGIDCGILLGRLQRDGYISYNCFNNLKKK